MSGRDHIKLSRDWDEPPENVVEGDLDAAAEVMAELLEKSEKTIALTKATSSIENKALVELDGVKLDQASFGTQTSYEPTVVDEAVNKLNVPPPPTMAFEGLVPFQCFIVLWNRLSRIRLLESMITITLFTPDSHCEKRLT